MFLFVILFYLLSACAVFALRGLVSAMRRLLIVVASLVAEDGL